MLAAHQVALVDPAALLLEVEAAVVLAGALEDELALVPDDESELELAPEAAPPSELVVLGAASAAVFAGATAEPSDFLAPPSLKSVTYQPEPLS